MYNQGSIKIYVHRLLYRLNCLILHLELFISMLDKANSSRPERRSAPIAHELSHHDIDIAFLSELTRADFMNMALVPPSSGRGNHQLIDAFLE